MEKNRVKNVISLEETLKERHELLIKEEEMLVNIANKLISVHSKEEKWSWSITLSVFNEMCMKDIGEDSLRNSDILTISEVLRSILGDNFMGYVKKGISISKYMKIIEILLEDIKQEKEKMSKILKL